MITGIAWDHRRCWGPLDASIEPYRRLTGEDVRWDRRSLYSFGEGNLGKFAEDYDLVIYDHPFVGDARKRGWLLDLNAFLTPEQKAHFASDEVGASWRSYAYGGGVWGLPIDTAAQTAAWRGDLIDRHNLDIPKSLDELPAFADRAAAFGLSIGWPSVPTDLMCTLVSIAASDGFNPGHGGEGFLSVAAIESATRQLKQLARITHPKSREWNPIRCLDHMAANDDVAYVPYLFNYVNYSSGIRRTHYFRRSSRRGKGFPRTLLAVRASASAPNPLTRAPPSTTPCIFAPGLPVRRLCDLRRTARQPTAWCRTPATPLPVASSATRCRCWIRHISGRPTPASFRSSTTRR